MKEAFATLEIHLRIVAITQVILPQSQYLVSNTSLQKQKQDQDQKDRRRCLDFNKNKSHK
ncbi:hypothetical protein VP466E531_P0002 [Vibrio phage 466E53-1]|nr:hypothetical protein VP466E531_P0002 [Vibrio phage 466E53-1]